MAKTNELYNLGTAFLRENDRNRYFSLLAIEKEGDPRKIIFKLKNDLEDFSGIREKIYLENRLTLTLQKIDNFLEIIELWKIGSSRSFVEKRGREILKNVENPREIILFKSKTPLGNNELNKMLDLRFVEILAKGTEEAINWMLNQLEDGVKSLNEYSSLKRFFIRQLRYLVIKF